MTDRPLTEAKRRLALPPGAYPFASHYAAIDGASLHFADEGSGPPVVMIHGNPTWSVLYRGLIEGLRGQHRCVAVDLAGFGLSGISSPLSAGRPIWSGRKTTSPFATRSSPAGESSCPRPRRGGSRNHFLWIDAPDECLAEVRGFLDANRA
ncbi:MAG TPA: alpha/beta fold hydrolase [Roseiarcus sp.]|jgi:hypothetical protein